MSLKRVLLIVGAFIVALTSVRLAWLFLFMPPGHARAVQGLIDMRDWDFGSERAVSLNGEWEFYPGRFLIGQSKESLSVPEGGQIAKVPGRWNEAMSKENGGTGRADSTFGYGSYRLRVLVQPDRERIYAIRMPVVTSSTELYVNGRLVGHSGTPASSREAYTARSVPYTASFATDRDEIEIIVQVANFDDRIAGGIVWPIKFGTDSAVDRSANFSIGLQLSVCLILLAHSVYSGILYVMGMRQKALLYFALMNVCAIVSVLIDDSRLLPVWSSMDDEWIMKTYYMAYLGIAAFLFQFGRHLLLPEKKKIWWLRAYTAICAAYAAAVPLMTIRWLTLADYIHTLLTMIPFLVVPALAFRAVVRGQKDFIYILLGVTAVMLSTVWGVVKNTGWMEMGFYPFDLIATFIGFALYWFKSYLRSSAQTARLAERLLEEDKRKDQFLVQTSHELRNPLHGMLNIAQTVLDDGGRSDEARNRDNLKLLVAVGKRMSYLLNDLLDLTRLKENRVHLQLRDVRVQAIASGVLDMIRVMIGDKPIRLANDIPEAFPPVKADENRLIQILFNLLHNAAKFTNEGTIKVDAYVRDGMAYICVSDTGIGMNEAALGALFEPYEQGGLDEPDGASGLGLGLGICKQLVELHNGTIEVSSSPNRGTDFSFSLPLSESTAPHGDETPSTSAFIVLQETAAGLAEELAKDGNNPALVVDAESASADRSSLLAVDDDPVNLSVLQSVLASENYDIVTCTSGEEALARLPSREWDLIIADVMMPNMSGYQLSRAIREVYSLSELPILLLTARSRPEDIEVGFQAGANDYLTKPVAANELKSRVRALTDGKQSFRKRLRMEAAWLQAQIQPHFLFNSLNAIASLSEFDTTRMRALLEAFGKYLRVSFDPGIWIGSFLSGRSWTLCEPTYSLRRNDSRIGCGSSGRSMNIWAWK
ncbi:response regulator [Cohnella faecalis]|uniref:histidine kinase n=1 Tax=Cohnella faecalis TaxID=2315694 RepID=A0A398CIV3_9BACL|nr:response regulator [Cohnella faecalis]